MPQQRERLKKPSGARSDSDTKVQPEPGNVAGSSKLTETDKLLADIDEILADVTQDETAEQFVANYRQKGGE